MAATHSLRDLDEQTQRALLALQARYEVASVKEALRLALQACDGSALGPARPVRVPAPIERRPAEHELQQFAVRAAHELQGPLFIVRTALELLSGCPPEQMGAEAKKFIRYGVEGVRQLQAAIDQLRVSTLGDTQAPPSTRRGGTAGRQSQRRTSPAPGAPSALAALRGAHSRGSHRRK